MVLGCSDRAIRGWDAGYNQRYNLDVMETDITKATPQTDLLDQILKEKEDEGGSQNQ